MKLNIKGFTLTEILVGVVVGMISIAAAFSAYSYYAKSYSSVSQKANTSKGAREALIIITKDLRNAGYFDPNFIGNSKEGISTLEVAEKQMISVRNKAFGKYSQGDSLTIWYTTTPTDRKKIEYQMVKYKNENSYYLARDVELNPKGGNRKVLYDDMLVPYVEDFQVVLKDVDGNVLMPVCDTCGAVERSQGSQAMIGSKTKGQDNMKKVHTAEIYLTVRSPKEIYKSSRTINIRSGEGSQGSNITVRNDKFFRDTFFASVHTRNLAIPPVQVSSSGKSIGEGQGYHK